MLSVGIVLINMGGKMQKYHKGDLVRVAKDLGALMAHFPSDRDAIVEHSYNDEYGGGEEQSHDYCVYFKGEGGVSWYKEHQLELLEPNRLDLLKTWEDEVNAENTQKSDLDWIFENGKDIVSAFPGYHGSTTSALGKCIGIDNMWGSHGEGFVFHENSIRVLRLVEPFLITGDKQGWLDFCALAKATSKSNKPEDQ